MYKLLFLTGFTNAYFGENGHGIWNKEKNVCCSHTENDNCVYSYPCLNFNSKVCTKNIHDNFVKFIHKFNKKYNSIEEFSYRLNIFAHNLAISKINLFRILVNSAIIVSELNSFIKK